MPKVYIRTYGCQMNVRDTEQVEQMFVERGYTLTADETEADVVLMNTCSVRDQAEQKALGNMARLSKLRRERHHVVYGFLGCMAQSRGAELVEQMPHVDLVAGTQKYHKVVDHVEAILKPRLDAQMEGCNMKCTFCIVPYTRGSERARPISQIVDEVKRLVDGGTKEVTLLGQIVNLYGRHEFPKVDGKTPFTQLLEAVHEVDGLERIRFTSPHPVGYKQDVIDAFTYLPKLASHVHFPMQSGSDRILKRMHRPYKAEKFIEICDRMKEARPDIAISTDVIVGFPGETDEDYLATKEVVKRVDFDHAFVFRYSKRKDTPAAEMDEQLPERVKEERNQDLLRLVDEISIRKNEALVGKTVQILCEGHFSVPALNSIRGAEIASSDSAEICCACS